MMKSLIILPLACSLMFFLSVASADTSDLCEPCQGLCCQDQDDPKYGECGQCQDSP